MKEGDTVGALESRLKMFDKYNEYTGKGNSILFNAEESELV